VTGFVEFAEGEVPLLLAQSGRAGARLTRDERYLSVNKDFKTLLQTTLPRVLVNTLAELWETSSYQRIKPAFADCQMQGPQMVRACRLQDDPFRRSFDLLLMSEPNTNSILQIFFEDGKDSGRDECRDELRRLRSIVHLAPVLISIKDRQGIIRLTNRLFGVLDGPEAEDYVSRSVFELFPREVAENLWKNDLAVFYKGEVIEVEECVRHRDGSEHTYLTYKFPLTHANGEITEVCAISTDITARKYYEQQAFEAVRKAEEANRVKSDFLAHMSHEIRTPLTVIRGYADLIARKTEAEQTTIRHWISSVMRASKQLELIINDILDLSKVEAGIVEIDKAPVDLHQLLHELHFSFALKAQEKNLDFRVHIHDAVPAIVVTDALRLRQVLDNLVSNALKFTDAGSVDISVELASDTSKPRLHLWVRDTGIGLSDEEQKKLFQPFIQADGSITRRFGGTGLGLVLAKRLAQLLGGDVRIHRSAPHAGTDMLVNIPVNELHQAPAPASTSTSVSLEVDSSQELRSRRLLIVEDAEDIRELLRYVLAQHGALVETAGSGEEALTQLAAYPFDLVLMDLQMPALDGMQTMKILRDRGFPGAVVAITAHALHGEREKCLKAGFDEFLSKPIHLPQVLNLIGNILATKKADANRINSYHES
jgi:PAS domain S-box-containing protein